MLPQLTVYAKIIYLLMVVISGALCTVEDYVIMSQCAHNKAIHVAAEGTVSVTDISQTQNITIVGLPDYVNNNLKIALYAKETQRYLCFNEQWKLVGMKELRDTCYFNETIVHGYFVFRSVVDLQRRVGFTHRGKAVGPKKNINDACYLFTKIQADQFFHQHTDYLAPKSKSTKNNNNHGISKSQPQTTTTTYTTSGASARMSSHRAALSAAATTATATATATAAHRTQSNNKNKRVNGMHNNNNNNNSKDKNNNNNNSNNNQNEEYTKGHSSNLSNNSNNSKLVSNKQQQQVVVSHQKHHNHSNNSSNNHHNNNSNSRTREYVRHQQQQQHQVRHHHNDPNLIARRQQHEHKQKRRQHQRQQQRLRSSKITSPTATTTTTTAEILAHSRASAPTITTQVGYSVTPTVRTLNNNSRQHNSAHELQQQHQQPTTLSNVAEKVATATTTTMKSTTIANKRKGRRRKGRKHRKQQQKVHQQQQMLPLRSQPLRVKEHTAKHAASVSTLPTWLLSESHTPADVSPSSTQTETDIGSSVSMPTTYGDYSGEWLSSLATFTEETSEASSSPSSLLLSSSSATSSSTSQASTHGYALSTTVSADDSSSLTPTSDYNNITDFTSDAFDEEDAFNATLVSEMDDGSWSPEPTLVTAAQLNSINSQQQQHLTTTLNGVASVSEEDPLAPTLTTFSESSDHSWSPATMGLVSDDDVADTMLLAPTAPLETESVAATSFLPDDDNATRESQTIADSAELYEVMNSTSSDIEADSSSSYDLTETLADIGSTAPTIHERFKNFSTIFKRKSKKPTSIAASIATLFYNQLLATSSRQENKYAWRPQHGDEYSDEIQAEKARQTTAASTTEIAESDRATWWQQHMNHSGTYFWDKGFEDVPPTASNEYDWHTRNHKHKTISKRRQQNRKTNNNSSNSRGAEVVSQQPLQALLTSDATSLSQSKKYLTESKSQRQASKARAHSNKLLSILAKATTQAYSSTMPTTRRAASTKARVAGVTRSTVATTANNRPVEATTTTTHHIYPLQQLLGNKTFAVLHSNTQAQHFDGNTNHLSHTSPTATTHTTTTVAAAAPTASTNINSAMAPTMVAATAGATTKKSLRISTQKLLATPFHQLTYVRNNAGDIDIDNIDNISVYPDLLDESVEMAEQHSTERVSTDVTRNSRLTIVSGYLPTSATAMLPESIRLAKVKINKERKRMMGLRQRHARRPA